MGLISGERAGVKQWFFQRVSNAAIVVFGVFFFFTLASGGLSTFESAITLMSNPLVKIFLLLILVLSCLNAILAGWQIAGDYGHKIGVETGLLTTLVILSSALFFAYGVVLIF